MKKNRKKICSAFIFAFIILIAMQVQAQKPFRAATTAANFLEIGYGQRISAMGDAGVAAVRDISSIYWNPAGLGFMEQNEAVVFYQPWYVGINTAFVGMGYVHPSWGTFAIGLINVSYGEEEVTTLQMQEGTGEKYDGLDMAVSLSYSKRIVDWFSFGASLKYVNSRIWHESASAVAFDLGAIVNTNFLMWGDKPGDGLNIGMSISNYGTPLQYDGLDLQQVKDISEEEEGNYPYVPVHFTTEKWELPLIFRIGVSVYGFKTESQNLVIAVDALHPNNNSESINVGAEYNYLMPGYGEVSIRGGYKGLYMDESHYGFSMGFGLNLHFLGNNKLKLGYVYRDFDILAATHSYEFGIIF